MTDTQSSRYHKDTLNKEAKRIAKAMEKNAPPFSKTTYQGWNVFVTTHGVMLEVLVEINDVLHTHHMSL